MSHNVCFCDLCDALLAMSATESDSAMHGSVPGIGPWTNNSTLSRLAESMVIASVATRCRVTRPVSSVAVLAALLDYARPGDAIVVVGIDRLGRNAAVVMTTIRELGGRDIVVRSLGEGIDAANAAGRMVAGVLASLAELELELGRERRTAAGEARRARGQSIGRRRALDPAKAALARRMHAGGEPVMTIAAALGRQPGHRVSGRGWRLNPTQPDDKSGPGVGCVFA